jgi:NADPH:quinone reductase
LRVVRYHRPGGPEVLQLDEVPRPEPGPGELLVEVSAAGVSLPVVRGTRTASGPWPASPGGEVAGRVAALGPAVEGWDVGDRVVAVAFGGAYAEFAAVPVAFAAAIPAAVGDAAAIAVLRNGQVALGALRAGGLVTGDRVLVTAAAGGVGHLAVQLARALGARRVVAAVGSTGKETFLKGLGADAVLQYRDSAAVWEEEVDLALDGAGGAALRRGVDALAVFGRLVSYSAAGGTVEVNDLRGQARSLIGFAVAHIARKSPDRYAQHREQLWQLVEGGALRPAVHAELPLTQAAHAHQALLDRENLGKVVLVT